MDETGEYIAVAIREFKLWDRQYKPGDAVADEELMKLASHNRRALHGAGYVEFRKVKERVQEKSVKKFTR